MGNLRRRIFRENRSGIKEETMVYINKKTGAVVETDCTVSGGDWEVQKPQKKKSKKAEESEAEESEAEESEG